MNVSLFYAPKHDRQNINRRLNKGMLPARIFQRYILKTLGQFGMVSMLFMLTFSY